ncbi:hypothetical protein [Maricaulis sp.]|uniref:SEL1-like repeat protein n=1 Tax=Maricaulis sp. TaxID=1486257 RepID=UPI0025BABFE9|nr:hypothetical protein [Maricaulis sp.]
MNRFAIGLVGGALLLLGVAAGVAINRGMDSEPSEAAIARTMADAEAAYARGEYGRVVDILGDLAEEGVPLAQYRLGLMYRSGFGVEADAAEARRLLGEAEAGGLEEARGPLAEMMFEAAQTADATEGPEAGLDFWEAAARLGDAEAQAVLGSYLLTGAVVGTPEPRRAITLLRSAGNAGHLGAQTNLGYAYSNGIGVERDDAEAFSWYLRASEGGLVRAQTVLGLFYETGRGTEPNLGQALIWYLNAYDAGAPGAAARLGRLLVAGEIESRNETDAAAWLTAAARAGMDGALERMEAEAEAGNADTLYALGHFYTEGEVVPQDDGIAVGYLSRAAELGAPGAQLVMAGRYATGAGVEQDYVEAHKWANLAAAAGVEGAASERSVIAQFLSPDDLAAAQARATAWRESRRSRE